MTGSQLYGYDMVIDFSETAYQRLLGTIFDTDGFLCDIINDALADLGVPALPCSVFRVDMSFDVPTDVVLPANMMDIIDVKVDIGENGNIGSLRFIAKIDVYRDTLGGQLSDILRVNLSPAGLLYTNIKVGPVDNTNGALTAVLHAIGSIPFLPLPVFPGSDNRGLPIKFDNRIIDDLSSSDLDSSALLVTCVGGSQGNKNGFNRSLVPVGDIAAIGISFDWICRILRPAIAKALDVDESYFDAPCKLNRSIDLQGDHNPKLTRFELTLKDTDADETCSCDNSIRIAIGASASGCGWRATATAMGSLEICVVNGQLIFETNIEDPDVDVRLEWWVYLTLAAIGSIVGGIIAGVIGALIGAILVPLVAWLLEDKLNRYLDELAHTLGELLRELNVNVNVPAIGLNLIFQHIRIDDVVIGVDVAINANTPIKSEGVLTVENDQWFDLDTGSVGDSTLAGADLVWEAVGTTNVINLPRRKLRTLCCTKLARTGSTRFDRSRYELYELLYYNPESIPGDELAFIIPVGGLVQSWKFIPLHKVYAVHTNEMRYSVIQVIEMSNDYIKIKYRTYEKNIPRVQILGGFNYLAEQQITAGQPTSVVGVDIAPNRARFEPSITKLDFGSVAAGAVPDQANYAPFVATKEIGQMVPPRMAKMQSVTSRTLGKWKIPVTVKLPKTGRFRAVVEMLPGEVGYQWSINKNQLDGNSGSVDIHGTTILYTIEEGNKVITLERQSDKAVYFDLAVRASGEGGLQLSTSRCIELAGTTTLEREAPVTWSVYQEAFISKFGSLEVPFTQKQPSGNIPVKKRKKKRTKPRRVR